MVDKNYRFNNNYVSKYDEEKLRKARIRHELGLIKLEHKNNTHMIQKNGVYTHTEFKENGEILSNCYFNLAHYSKVIKTKRERGEVSDVKDRIIDHELTGKRILRNGKEYIVENVYKMWWLGYYLHALLVTDKNSHGGMDFKNISSMCEFTQKTIEEENKYEILTT